MIFFFFGPPCSWAPDSFPRFLLAYWYYRDYEYTVPGILILTIKIPCPIFEQKEHTPTKIPPCRQPMYLNLF